MSAHGAQSDRVRRIAWVLGWAVPEAWFAALVRAVFPGAEHVFIAATSEALARVEAAQPLDWVAGYSLGSLLLLNEPERASRCGRVALLAPVFAFAREEGMGGRVARAQIEYLARWVRRDRAAALADFYQRTGLDVPPNAVPDTTPEELAWGLERLARDRAAPVLPPGWRAWCGATDPLLDAAVLAAHVPAISVVADGAHHPRALLRAMAEAVA